MVVAPRQCERFGTPSSTITLIGNADYKLIRKYRFIFLNRKHRRQLIDRIFDGLDYQWDLVTIYKLIFNGPHA